MRANVFTVHRHAARYGLFHSGVRNPPGLKWRPSVLVYHHVAAVYHGFNQKFSPHLLYPSPCTEHFPTTLALQRCRYTSRVDKTSFADPSRPDLFYHLIHPPTPVSSSLPAFAISFLPAPPPSPDSCTIIGWLPAAAEGTDQEAGLNDFTENRAFREVLHTAINAGLAEAVDEVQINRAVQTQRGWMHIHDNRNVPALGRIGDPDDIIASVLVENGKILPETYQAMPSYRFCTADGLPQLTVGLAEKLKAVLEECARTEGNKVVTL